jgi:hypothetical protein
MGNYIDGNIAETSAFIGTLTDAQVLQDYTQSLSADYQPASDPPFELVFSGSIDRGSFSRNVQVGGMSILSVTANDNLKTMAIKKQRNAAAYEDYYLARATPSSNSLIHELVWAASKKEIINYLGNSDFENAIIANSWNAAGVGASFVRSSANKLFGSYSGYLTGTSGLSINQSVTIDLSANDRMTFQFYAYDLSGVTITPTIKEYLNSTLVSNTANATVSAGLGWQLYTVEHIVSSSSSNKITVDIAISASGVYFDMCMLTFGGVKYFYVQNLNDGSVGVIPSVDSDTGSYAVLGIDAEDVSYQCPWALVKSGESPYEHSKQVSDASICRLYGINQAGVFKYRSNLTSDIAPLSIGSIEKVSQISAVNQPISANKVTVEGVRIEKNAAVNNIWEANSAISEQSDYSSGFLIDLAASETWPDTTTYPDGIECIIIQ